MNSERWQKIEDIFQEALEMPLAERSKFIRENSDDEEIRGEVEKLVARYETEENFLESPVWTDSQILHSEAKRQIFESLDEEIFPDKDEKSLIGERIGVYKLKKEIGRGGMGAVYLAERADGEFQQKVAVKLIKRGMDTDFIVKRFRHERQILANFNHPFIARLLDGGTTKTGTPYFVMEFVEGLNILEYSEKHKFDLRQKLELFRQICQAVEYAHKHKIIHRDIKPSNILINEDGVPKLLDFGIAKILDPNSIHESVSPTASQMFLMTPEYASPEQVKGETLTPKTDQYSLGVLLYELLTGKRPYKFKSRSPHEIARVICEEIPSESSGEFEKLITAEKNLTFDKDTCEKLNTIVLRTLRKNSAERYESVNDFATDIERFLRNETVQAKSFLEEKTTEEIISDTGKIREKTEIITNDAEIFSKKRKSVSPRSRGIKQGIFLLISSVVLIPLFLGLIITGLLDPVLAIVILLIMICGGIVRIIYALMFEEKISEPNSSFESKSFAEEDTKILPKISPEIKFFEDKRQITEADTKSEKLIAVLPFNNLNTFSGEETTGGTEFLSVGLADALITRLSNIRRFVVRPTSSVLRFAAEEKMDAFTAGEELKVEYILDGSVLRIDKKIRISVQLLDVKKQTAIWAERFDEDFTDFLDLEDSISAKVIKSLVPQLSNNELEKSARGGTNSSEAYEAYLRGRFHWNKFSEEGFQQAIESYRKAIEIDPEFALAYAGIADYYIWLGVYGILPTNEFCPPAIDAAKKGISLDDKLSEAYAAYGLALHYGEFDWTKSEKFLKRAVNLNPNNSFAHIWLSHRLYAEGRFDEGRRHIERSLEIDPFSFMNHNTYAWSFNFSRQPFRAVEEADKLIEKFPQSSHSYFAKSCFLARIGKAEEALAASNRSMELSNDHLFNYFGYALALAAAGKCQEVEKIIGDARGKKYVSHYQAAQVFCYLENKEKAFEHLELAFANYDTFLVWLAIEPSLDFIRDDERYFSMLKRINHPLA